MKAIRVHQFGEQDVLQYESVDMMLPAANQLLIKIKSIGINPVDTYIRSGTHAVRPSLPYTPGFDAAGVIESVGNDVKHFDVGQRVYLSGSITGCYADHALCTEDQVHCLPRSVTYSQGAAVGIPYATAYYALMYRAHAMPGDSVLVHGGSGAVGVAAIQFARAAGMRVIATAGSDAGKTLVREVGAHEVLDHSTPDYLDQIMELTCGQGVNVVLEMLANENLDKDLRVLAKQGRIVVIGCRGEVNINPRDIMGRDAAILGMSLFNASDRQKAQIYSAITAGLENEALKPVVGKEFSLSEAAKAHQSVLEPGSYGKIVLNIGTKVTKKPE